MVAGQLIYRSSGHLRRLPLQFLPSSRFSTRLSFSTRARLASMSHHNLLSLVSSRYLPLSAFQTSSSDRDESLAEKAAKIIADGKKKAKPTNASSEPSVEKPEAKKATTEASGTTTQSTAGAKTTTSASEAGPQVVVEPTSSVVEKKAPLVRRVWFKIVKECKHYYHGFRLLFIDVKICTRYVWNLLNGATLTRRERRQLVRTTADLFRLVPFIPFIIVPFMEFLLPVAIKIFPGMLPSTFQEANKEKEKKVKRLKAKLEIAKFLQDTVEESALKQTSQTGNDEMQQLAKEFSQFLKEIREQGTTVTTQDIQKFSQLFKDDITLDNMSRPHLVALCRLLDIQPIGPNKILVFQIRMKLRSLKFDDEMIMSEGLGSLSTTELQTACRARGMRAIGVSEWRLRYQLRQWLELHLEKKVPISLLLMSRALYLPEHLSTNEKLEKIIRDLPENIQEEAALHAADLTGEEVDPEVKRKALLAEEAAIKQEKAEALKEKEEVEKAEAKTQVDDLTEKDQKLNTIIDKAHVMETMDRGITDLPPVPGASSEPSSTRSPTADSVNKEEAVLSSSDVEMLEDVLEKVAEEKSHRDANLEDLEELVQDFETYQRGLVSQDLGSLGESKSAKRLSSAVDKMIKSLGSLTDDLHKQKQAILQDIEVKEVKMKRNEDLQQDQVAMESMEKQIEQEKENVISINELVLAMKRLQKVPDETRLQSIVKVLDEDEDGIINIANALEVLQELGTENVNIKGSQMSKILDMVKKQQETLKKKKEAEEVEEWSLSDLESEGQDPAGKSETLRDPAKVIGVNETLKGPIPPEATTKPEVGNEAPPKL